MEVFGSCSGWLCRQGWLEGIHFFAFLVSLAYGDVMSWLGSIVVLIGCCGGVAVVRLMGALGSSGRSKSVVPVCVLTR